MDQRIYLKIKLKSLAAEAKIIRAEEKKYQDQSTKQGLYLHRVLNVRNESRATFIAYGYLRGRKYSQIEPHCRTKLSPANIDRIKSLVKKYSWFILKNEPFNMPSIRKQKFIDDFDNWLKE